MIISLIISLVIFIIFEICLSQVFKFYSQSLKGVQKISRNINNEKIKIIKESDIKEKQLEEIKEDLWQIEIPKINLIAPIAEGTSQEVMLEYVGHFENTAQWEGNIGLAAHNRGYPINYFSKLKELKNGDKVIYKSKDGTKMYSINFIKIIEDTNWSYLEKTKENKITLITCVENEPSQRLCIQGIEIKEE